MSDVWGALARRGSTTDTTRLGRVPARSGEEVVGRGQGSGVAVSLDEPVDSVVTDEPATADAYAVGVVADDEDEVDQLSELFGLETPVVGHDKRCQWESQPSALVMPRRLADALKRTYTRVD